MLTSARFALYLWVPLLAAACVVQSTDHSPGSVEVSGGAAGTGNGSSSGPSNGSSSPSAHPILAQIDTDQTMTAQPGQGVGVFAEYVSGGHWHVWWTCDSSVNPSSVPCGFDVKASVASGSITNATTQQFEASDSLVTGAQQIEAKTTTTTATDGVTFDTAPGATITLSTTLGQQYDGQLIFFVEDGKIDDGDPTVVTDPIQLQPTRP